MTTPPPSEAQAQILQFIRENELAVRIGTPRKSLLVTSRAGSGKSTTCQMILETVESYGASPCYTMFTSRTVKEFLARAGHLTCAKRGIATCHAFGRRALAFKLDRSVMQKDPDDRKVYRILSNIYKGDPQTTNLISEASKLVRLAKNQGFGLETQPEITDEAAWLALMKHHSIVLENKKLVPVLIDMAINGLTKSNADLTCIDFDDMIYLALLLKAPFEQYDVVVVDEAQDVNATRMMCFQKMKKPWGCVIVVGDDKQAIMGFTGADNQALTLMKDMFDATELKLTVCYRCPITVIKEAQKFCPDITPGPEVPLGKLVEVEYKYLLENHSRLQDEDIILCRFNAPNVMLAFQLIRLNHPCRIEGRDIGKDLAKIAERLDLSDMETFTRSLISWEQNQTILALTEQGKMAISDKAAMLRIMAKNSENIQMLPGQIELLFKDSERERSSMLTLSTVHKAKGGQWQRVFVLGYKQFMPSPFVTSAWGMEQENNLRYVAITRAQSALIYINNVPEN